MSAHVRQVENWLFTLALSKNRWEAEALVRVKEFSWKGPRPGGDR